MPPLPCSSKDHRKGLIVGLKVERGGGGQRRGVKK